jgi:hypothetical protein
MRTGVTRNMQAGGYEDVRQHPAVIPWFKGVHKTYPGADCKSLKKTISLAKTPMKTKEEHYQFFLS